MILLASLLLVAAAVAVHDAIRRPTLRRLAFRNVARRRGEALLVVAGSLLGTAIITASFIVGGSLGASVRDSARTQLGPIDEAVTTNRAADLDAIATAVGTGGPNTDGTLRLINAPVTVVSTGAGARAEPDGSMVEVDFVAARRFGGNASASGFADAGPTPSGDEAAVGRDLARALDLKVGDAIVAHAYGTTRRFRVREIIGRRGVAGFPGNQNSESPNLLVPPGTIAAMAARASGPAVRPPVAELLVSNTGGVFSGNAHSLAVKAELQRRVHGIQSVDVLTLKRDTLDDADANAKSFTQLFGGIGAFSVIAGILLLVNIFVMLADERKSELGMLRAVGLKRNHLVRAFGMEGFVYSLASAVAGAVVGIGLGRVIVAVARALFNQRDRFRLDLRFTVTPHDVVTGFVIGTAISVITVWATSLRIGRLNVIRAIRDLPEPTRVRARLRTLVLCGIGVLLGAVLFAGGVASKGWFGALVGPTIAAFCAIPLLTRLLPARGVITVACLAALTWGVVCFGVLPTVFHDVDIPVFVVQGVILVSTAVAVLAVNADLSVNLIERLSGSGRTLAARLGLAYPLARRFRTSMLLGMYALVIFTLTFLAVFSKLFAEQGPRFIKESSAGYDLVVDSNPADPVTPPELQAFPGVTAVATLLRTTPEFTNASHPDRTRWTLTGVDDAYLARSVPKLSSRQARFATDREAWTALMHDPSLVIVPEFFLSTGGGPPRNRPQPGDVINVYSRGQQRPLRLAGIASSDWVFGGAMVGADFARSFFGGEAAPSRAFVAVAPGVDGDALAQRLTARLLTHGVDARTIRSEIDQGLHQQEGFFTLMQGYLALGLLVGVAGLGVVMVRAVRERRRQIGMLRAMGFPSRVVRAAFLLEAGFVAAQGVLLGVVLALIVSYQVLSSSKTFSDQELHFTVPWAALAIVLTATVIASLIAVLAPATQASRIKPAVALRITD